MVDFGSLELIFADYGAITTVIRAKTLSMKSFAVIFLYTAYTYIYILHVFVLHSKVYAIAICFLGYIAYMKHIDCTAASP